MNFETFLKHISKIENITLPGESAQIKMAPPFRKKIMQLQKQDKSPPKKAAVLALFYPDLAHNTKFILTLRKSYKGVHSGQVAFPGGKLEKNDLTMQHTALRETYEEIGVLQEEMSVIKSLSQLYIPPSHFKVYPYIGVVSKTPIFTKQESEVEEILEIPLTKITLSDNISTQKVIASHNKAVEVPAFVLNGHIVWGATAMIISEIKDLLKQVF